MLPTATLAAGLLLAAGGVQYAGQPVLCSRLSIGGKTRPLLVAALWLALPAVLLPAQQQAFTLHGSVVDAITKQPIARALVATENGDAVLTDTNGQFEFSDVSAGYTSVVVRRPGYISNVTGGGFAPSQDQRSEFQVNVGPNMQPLVLPITPEAVITGQISLLDSDAPDDIQVTAYRKVAEDGRPKWEMAGMATTNSEGIFRIASLSAGSYLLYAQPSVELYMGPDNPAEPGYAAVYFPGVTDAAAAGVVKLATGEHKQADIALVRQTLYPVTIKLANAPQANYGLQIWDSGGLPVQPRMRFEEGQQTVHTELAAGRYVVNSNIFDSSNNTQLVGRTEFTVTSAAVTYVGVTVLPLRAIPVTIRREFTVQPNAPAGSGLVGPAGAPAIAANRGQEPFANPGINLSLVGADQGFGRGYYGLESASDSNDGSSYQIKNVPPGKYWVVADAGQNYISSISSGGVDLTENMLTVGQGGASAPIEITLRNDGGSIEGTFSAGQPEFSGEVLPFLFVCAIPLFPTASAMQSMRVQASGKFTLDNLAPGPYRVVACASQQQIEYRTPEGRAAWESKGQVVNVEPGGTAHVQLDVTPAEEQPQ